MQYIQSFDISVIQSYANSVIQLFPHSIILLIWNKKKPQTPE